MKINWTKSEISDRYFTQEYSSLLGFTYQGLVSRNFDGTWDAFIMCKDNKSLTKFNMDNATKKGATRWVNSQLRNLKGD